MAVAFHAGAGSTGNGTTTDTLTIPASTTYGEDLYLAVSSRNHTSGDAYPGVTDNDTGGNTWTKVSETTDRKLTVWTKKATATTASKTVTVTGALDSIALTLISVTGGASGGDGAPGQDYAAETNASGDETSAGITPTNANSLIVVAFLTAGPDLVTTVACTDPGALTQRATSVSTGGGDVTSSIWTGLQSGGPTATGNVTYSLTPNSASRTSIFSVKPGVALAGLYYFQEGL